VSSFGQRDVPTTDFHSAELSGINQSFWGFWVLTIHPFDFFAINEKGLNILSLETDYFCHFLTAKFI
jgi:hypothetical protein